MVTLRGVASVDEEGAVIERLETEVERLVDRARARRQDNDRLAEDVRRAVRRVCGMMIGKKPVTEVHIFRV
jgi:mRNA degradation ribonuclease J1/J2